MLNILTFLMNMFGLVNEPIPPVIEPAYSSKDSIVYSSKDSSKDIIPEISPNPLDRLEFPICPPIPIIKPPLVTNVNP